MEGELLLLLLMIVLSSAASTIQWVDCYNHLPLSQNVSGLLSNTPTLPLNLHCGRIVVPMNYGEPIGPRNNITLGLAMVRPQQPKGAIFLYDISSRPAG